jgi:hypothetical protein
MSSSTYYSISNALSIGTIIAIVVGSVVGLAILIGSIIVIVCIVKHLNRSKTIGTRGMVLQQPQPYPYPQSLSTQYPPTITSVSNYPPAYPPYTSQNYDNPAYT